MNLLVVLVRLSMNRLSRLVIAQRLKKAVQDFRTTVAATMHSENRSIQRRARNFVISGLRETSADGDRQNVINLIGEELGLWPDVSTCKRLGDLTNHHLFDPRAR